MKMVIRGDDVGYTDVCNIGTFEAIEKGIMTSADLMLDTPGTVDALERLSKLPWISVGWHSHFWGAPVLDPKQVPSLVIKETGRFRHDINTAEDVVLDEILAECHAQMQLCLRILGRVPDTGGMGGFGGNPDSPFRVAMRHISAQYGLVGNYAKRRIVRDGVKQLIDCDLKWRDRNIYYGSQMSSNIAIQTESVTELAKYDPLECLVNNEGNLLEEYDKNDTVVMVWHPGYVDNYVYKLGDHGLNAKYYITSRVAEVAALTSERAKNWIKSHNVELVNFKDALYGTNEYQNHLKAIGSDLYML